MESNGREGRSGVEKGSGKRREVEAEEKLKKEQRRAMMDTGSKPSSGDRESRTEAGQGTRASMSGNSTRSYTTPRNTRHGSSAHPEFWPKVQGSNRCSVCSRWVHAFIL